MSVRNFRINVSDAALQHLQNGLENARWPASLDPDSWDDGASISFMKRLVDHWVNHFDWRAQEERLSRLANKMMTVDDQDIHFVHQEGRGPVPMPLILTHGWLGSFVEMEHIIPLLADPAAHGGDPVDAFHVVVPSLPGYGFSRALAPWREFQGDRHLVAKPYGDTWL